MTQYEIIEMARQAGFDPHDMSSDFTCNLENINAFAKLVAEKERTWVGLTDDEIAMWRPRFKFSEALIREVEAKLKEKNT